MEVSAVRRARVIVEKAIWARFVKQHYVILNARMEVFAQHPGLVLAQKDFMEDIAKEVFPQMQFALCFIIQIIIIGIYIPIL